MKAVGNLTSWVRYGVLKNVSFICKDIICYGTGCHIQFLNISTHENTIFTANFPSVNGDGVRVIEGHRTVYTFAYSEYCKEATLYVKTFPEFENISVFKNGPPGGYSALTFSETSLLIALGHLPDFTLYVFNWRNNQKVRELKSDILLEEQILRCNWGKPVLMAQLGKNSKNLYFWDLFTFCKKSVLEKHEVLMPNYHIPPLSDFVWTSENTLFLVDSAGNVYMCDVEFTLVKVIDSTVEGDLPTSMAWYKAGLLVSGPNHALKHYKKSDVWICDWILDLEVGLRQIYCNRTDFVIGITIEEELVKISNTDGVFHFHQSQSKFSDFCLIYPTASHIVALAQNAFLNVFSVEDGNWVSTFGLSGHALCVTENPEYPYVAVGYSDGRLELISAFHSENLFTLITFNLCSTPLNTVKFFENGNVIVAGYFLVGKFFILEGVAGSKINIICHVEIGRQIVDYMLVGSRQCQRLFAIPVTSKYLASNQILRYCIMDQDNINVKQYFAERKDSLYYRIIPSDKPNRDRIFYALCLTSRNIHVLEIRRGDSTVRVISEIKTGHQMRKFDLRLNSRHALTWGFDGFVMGRCNEFKEEIGMALPHHRHYGGVKKAYMDVSGKFIISLGRDEILTCTDLVENIYDMLCYKESVILMESPRFLIMFRKKTTGFQPEERFKGKTWREIQEILKTEEEEKICRAEKESILEEFREIKETIISKVTHNMTGPDNEKIDLLEFFLDTVVYNQKKLKNKEECKETEINMKALMVAQDKVTSYLKTNYLQPMGVVGKIIRGIFQRTMATNYVLLPHNEPRTRQLAWIEELRKVEQYLSISATFEPWLRLEKADLLRHLRARIVLTSQDYASFARRVLDEALINQRTIETQIALIGSVSQLYIERNFAHLRQRELVTFHQCDMQQIIAEFDVIKLKQEYNRAFEQMMEEKYRELENTKKKNARMRHIISEFNYFSNEKVNIDIVDPEWTQDEQPWLLEKVLDDELTVTPYVSPSEQAMLDAKAAEEERIRLALLADDFRERALMTMMNGVLEVKWEDELKKEVPLPKCMLEKDPAQFNEEDLRAIRDYEEKCLFLNSERERYKNQLDIEYSKLASNLKDSIKKFNQRLRDSIEYKMYIDSGMNQENLQVNRARLNHNERIKLFKKELNIKQIIVENEQVIADLSEKSRESLEVQAECKSQFEAFQAKEKVLEKTFKKEFIEASPVVQEQAIKMYRKRPRATFRHINTSAVLFELAKCIIIREKSKILTSDCLDYMKALDNLDHFIGLPPTIDENTNQLICKHRRLRIEYEIRTRANQLQLQDGDLAIATFQKRVVTKKEKNVQLQSEMENVRKSYLYLLHNLQTQIVMRRGLVELPLTGDVKDFQDAVLVPRSEIEQINNRIKAAGEKKIATIMRNMAFRRNIMATEWEHLKLRMQINDCIEHIRDIEGVKFTREMQQYLKSKAFGRKQDSYEQQMEVITACYENTLRDKKDKYNRLMKQMKGYKEHNSQLDKAIQDINIDVCHLKLQEDTQLEKKEHQMDKSRMETLLKRNSLVRQIQQNHNEILVLQTELELLRLKTYPTFKYKLINSSESEM